MACLLCPNSELDLEAQGLVLRKQFVLSSGSLKSIEQVIGTSPMYDRHMPGWERVALISGMVDDFC